MDIGANLLDKSKQKAGDTAAYIADKYSITRDGVLSWSAEKYNSFAAEYPDIAANIESFSVSAAKTSDYVFEKSKDGVVIAYQMSASGVKTAVDWTDQKFRRPT